LWLDEDGHLANRFKRKSEDIIENLFGTELLKLCSSQDLIICNYINKWPLSSQMNCSHGLGSTIMDYAISDIHVLNHITNFELLNGYESNFDSDHRSLSLSINLAMHTTHMQENKERKNHIHFDRSKANLFLRDLERNLGSLTYNNNIDQIYYHFTTTLSTTIKKLSNKTSYKKNNRTSCPWYDKHYKIVRKTIREAPNETIKL